MPTEFDTASLDFDSKTAPEVLAFANESYDNDLLFAVSGSLEDVALLHMACALGIRPRAAFVDTGRHFEETYKLLDDLRRTLDIDLRVITPDPSSLFKLARRDGLARMSAGVEERKRCCEVRRIEPFKRIIKGVGAFVVGARRAHADTRRSLKKIEVSELHDWGVRVAPLADWSWAQVVGYAQQHKLPIHPLYRKAFTSIGCSPCTSAIKKGQPERAGRWSFEDAGTREHGPHISGKW